MRIAALFKMDTVWENYGSWKKNPNNSIYQYNWGVVLHTAHK